MRNNYLIIDDELNLICNVGIYFNHNRANRFILFLTNCNKFTIYRKYWHLNSQDFIPLFLAA